MTQTIHSDVVLGYFIKIIHCPSAGYVLVTILLHLNSFKLSSRLQYMFIYLLRWSSHLDYWDNKQYFF
jgi:hypothetical protein